MGNAAASTQTRNPPIDYAVAAWLGMPKADMAKGLHEGWLRAPVGVDVRAWAEQRGLASGGERFESAVGGPIAPPGPDHASPVPQVEATTADLRTRVEALLRQFDPGMDAETFEGAWLEAGADDAVRGDTLVSFVADVLALDVDRAAGVDARLEAVEAGASAFAGHSRFIRIVTATSRELETLAAGDGGVRRALAEGSPWALAGDASLARAADAVGRYDRFDRDTGEQLLSDAWIADRAKHTAWRNAQAAGDAPEVDGEGWRFVDRAAGQEATTVVGGSDAAWRHQVIFATDEGDRITGDAGTDRIHGGRGDDILRGRAGDDLLEGDAGNDVLQGGAGRDVIAGQQGSDELDGGSADDDLSGGSGDDELVGGRGNDVLRGGAGHDTYRFDEGDGNDTIADDSGVLVVDDVALSGTMLRSGDGWQTADGRFRFALEGGASEHSLVVRRSSGQGSDAASDAVRIASWTDGDLGISLEAEAERTPGDGTNPHGIHEGGNEGPLGANARVASPDDAAADSALVDAHVGMPATALSADEQSTAQQHDDLAFVDLPDFSSALRTWSAPPPPEVEPSAGVGVTSYDVSDALASAGLDGDDVGATEAAEAAAGTSLFDPASIPLFASPASDRLRSPPHFPLRPSP